MGYAITLIPNLHPDEHVSYHGPIEGQQFYVGWNEEIGWPNLDTIQSQEFKDKKDAEAEAERLRNLLGAHYVVKVVPNN